MLLWGWEMFYCAVGGGDGDFDGDVDVDVDLCVCKAVVR